MAASVKSDSKSQHGTWLEIRLDRLEENLESLKKQSVLIPDVMAVIKANAYGHGLLEVAKTLNGRVTYLAVASVRDALVLREAGIETPVFLFGKVFKHELPLVLTHGITLSISSWEEAGEISEASEALFRRTPVHIKVDTGMGRLGLSYREARPLIEQIASLPGLLLEGIYTHFATAEMEDGYSRQQLDHFLSLIQMLRRRGIRFQYRHAANSAGVVKIKNNHLNMIRPGLMLYGIYPDLSLRRSISVAPILSLKSRIILLKELRAGDSAGYSRHFVAQKPTRVAILPIGYSHGYPLGASNNAFCLFHGKRFKVAGRVSMDYLAVDLEEEAAHIGEEVTLIGENAGDCITVEELALWSGTIPYEIATRLVTHLPRFYSNRKKESPKQEVPAEKI